MPLETSSAVSALENQQRNNLLAKNVQEEESSLTDARIKARKENIHAVARADKYLSDERVKVARSKIEARVRSAKTDLDRRKALADLSTLQKKEGLELSLKNLEKKKELSQENLAGQLAIRWNSLRNRQSREKSQFAVNTLFKVAEMGIDITQKYIANRNQVKANKAQRDARTELEDKFFNIAQLPPEEQLNALMEFESSLDFEGNSTGIDGVVDRYSNKLEKNSYGVDTDQAKGQFLNYAHF